MFTTKKLIIAVVVGLAGYVAATLASGKGLAVPGGADIAVIAIFIATALIAALLSGTEGNAAPSADSGRETGTVKWFKIRKGYGFITRDQGDDVFVHFRNIEDNGGNSRRGISEGQRVSFIVTSGDKGPQADKVVPA